MLRINPRLRPWLLVFGLVYVAYLVAGNVFLNTPIGRHVVNRKAERFRMQWTVALTLWPGDLLVWNVDLHGHAHRTLWTVHGDFAHGRIGILPLFVREFRIASIQATNVRIETDPATFDLAPSPKTEHPWRLRFDRIASISLKRLRAHEAILDGEGTVAFGFIKEVHGGPWQLLPSQVHMRSAHFTFEQVELFRAARVDAGIEIAEHTHQQASGVVLLQLVKGRLAIDGVGSGLSLRSDASGGQALSNTVGGGRARVELNLANNRLQAGDRIAWSAPLRIIDAHGAVRHDGQVLVNAAVGDGAIAVRMAIPPAQHGLGSLDAELKLAGKELPAMSWHKLAPRLAGAIDLDWQFTSLRWLTQAVTRAHWLRIDGSGEVIAALHVQAGQLVAGSRVDVPVVGLQADLLDNVFAGSGRAQGRLLDTAQGPRPHLAVVIDRFTIASRDTPDRIEVRGRDLRLDLDSSNALAEFSDSFHAALRFANASASDLSAYNRYLPKKSVQLLGGSGDSTGAFAMDADGHVQTGRVRMDAVAAQIVLAGARLTSNATFDGRLARSDRSGRRFVFSGSTLALQDLLVNDEGPDWKSPWWGRLTFDRGIVEWTHPLRIDGHARLDMKDIRPLLLVFAKPGKAPKWALRLIDAGEVSGQGQMQVRDASVILDRVTASNTLFDLDAHMRIGDGRMDGDLYLHSGLFGLGIGLHDGKRDLHLFGAKKWYEAQPHLLPPETLH